MKEALSVEDTLKLALEAIEFVHDTGDTQTFDMCYAKPALAAIKKSLAQSKQEFVKDWIASHNDICALLRQAHDALALTSYPPQRKTFNHDEFGYWWFEYGSGLFPLEGEDQEEHAYRVATAAWQAAHGIKGD